MNTNDVIIGTVEQGSFRFPIEFGMFGYSQYIADATFDTGCSHSLISAKSLNIGNKKLVKLKEEALYDIDVKLSVGKGIESKEINTVQLKQAVIEINNLKKQLVKKKYSKEKAKIFLEKHISNTLKTEILDSKLVRFEYLASQYKIDGVEIGNFKVKVSFDLGKVNLIGMHIIKDLYTKIFSDKNQTYLLAKKNSPLADMELDMAMDELKDQLELLDMHYEGKGKGRTYLWEK